MMENMIWSGLSCVFFCLSATAALGQDNGAIAGRIVDEFGIPVSGAVVVAKNTSGQESKSTSATKGEYTIDKLATGSYDVTITAISMKPYTKKGVAVESATVPLDATLLQAGLGTLGDGDRFTAAVYTKRKAAPVGPAPRLADGKPDFSGFWVTPFADPNAPPPAERPEQAQPRAWADQVRRERQASNMRDLPDSRCLPSSVINAAGTGEYVHTPTLLVAMPFGIADSEPPRQIFLDGREHPKDPNPTWRGHSVGHWEGDTLVVDTIGFNGLAWYGGGLPSTENLHVIERYKRPDLGHLEVEVTVEDPAVLQKPWTQKRVSTLDPNPSFEEYVCNENNKDLEHMFGK